MGRAYPLCQSSPALQAGEYSVTLPDSVVVEFTCVAGPVIAADVDNALYLQSATKASGTITFVFWLVSGDSHYVFTFAASVAAELASYTATAVQSTGDGACTAFLARAWLIVGSLVTLAENMSESVVYLGSATTTRVEPSRIRYTSYVSTVTLSNSPRTCITLTEGCGSSPAVPNGTCYTGSECLAGGLRFKPGYNCEITQLSGSNTLRISSDIGAGEGAACGEVAIPGEPEVEGLLSGGPDCSAVVKTINGLEGPAIQLIADAGVTIEATGAHSLAVTASLAGLMACPET